MFCKQHGSLSAAEGWEAGTGVLYACWLGYLFYCAALIVDLRLVPNLATISEFFRLSDVVAGVTLLALGNGAADIITAMTSVEGSRNGGNLAIAGLVGSALFGVVVNTSVIAFCFSPVVDPSTCTRDLLVLVLALAAICYILEDEFLLAWEAITFFVLYLIYILVVIFRERKKSQWFDDAANMADSDFFDGASSGSSDSEYAEWETLLAPNGTIVANDGTEYKPPKPMLDGNSPSVSSTTSPVLVYSSAGLDSNSYDNGAGAVVDRGGSRGSGGGGGGVGGSDGAAHLLLPPPPGNENEKQKHQRLTGGRTKTPVAVGVAHARAATFGAAENDETGYTPPPPLPQTAAGHRMEVAAETPVGTMYMMSDVCNPSEKYALFRFVSYLLQAPVRLLVLACVPIVISGKGLISYNRHMLVVNCVMVIPLMLAILYVDALFSLQYVWTRTSAADVAIVAGGVAAVLLLLTMVWFARKAPGAKSPSFMIAFAFIGMLAALVLIFAIAQEVVSLMSSFAAWLDLSQSFIGMIAVGIGNGSSDLVANYLVAKRGWPRIAMAAILGGAVLNTLLGTAACTVLGVVKWGEYAANFDTQLITGLAFLGTASVAIGVRIRRNQMLGPRDGIALMTLYGIYLITSVAFEFL